MANLDLTPKDYVRSQVLRRRMKWLVWALLLLAGMVVAARLALGFLARSESLAVVQLQEKGQLVAQAQAKGEEYRKQKQVVEKQLTALDELRGRDRLRLFLSALDAAYLNGIWFDAIRYYRSETIPTGNLDALPGGARAGIIVVPKENVPVPGAAPRPQSIEQRVELLGHALSHSQVAEFMRALGRQPGIADVRLVDTGLRAYTSTLVIDFKLSLLVDDKAGRQP